MKRFSRIAESFLREVGHIGPRALGPGALADEVTREAIKRLEKRLAIASRDSRWIVSAIVGVCILIVIAGIVLAVIFRSNPVLVATFFGGASTSTIVFAVTFMRTAWREKYQIDILVSILPMLPPEKAIEIVEKLYFNSISQLSTRRAVGKEISTIAEIGNGAPAMDAAKSGNRGILSGQKK